jgi:hypothetical protein
VSDQLPQPRTDRFINHVTAPKRRRWKRWVVLFLFLSALCGISGFIYWAMDTNQLGKWLSREFAQRLPAHLHIGKSEFSSLEELILSDVQLMPKSGDTAVVTVDRVIVYGPLWKGKLDTVRIENLRLHATADAVRFLHAVIKKELSIPATGTPSLLHLDFTGGVYVNGEIAITDAEVGVDTTGPMIAVTGKALYGGNRIGLTIATEGNIHEREYRISLEEGVLPIWRSCDWLAELELLPHLPEPARAWVPEFADARGTVINADKNWQKFSGTGIARWTPGTAQGKIYVDGQRIDLQNVILRDKEIGNFNGSVQVDSTKNITRIYTTDWQPGPRVPIPAVIPTKPILQTFPGAEVITTAVADGWMLSCRLFHPDNNSQALLNWGPTWPLTVEGREISLPLLQSFIPNQVSLAAGQAKELNAVINSDGLRDFSATIEGGRFLWSDWALGSFNGKINVNMSPQPAPHAAPDGVKVRVDAPGMGKLSFDYQTNQHPPRGYVTLGLTHAEALAVRLKGPVAIPDISGAIDARAILQTDNDVLRMEIEQVRLQDVAITDIMRYCTTSISGVMSFYPNRVAAHLVGQLTKGEVRLPGSWHDLSRRQPIYNAQMSFGNAILLLENLLVRATDATGAAKIDGFSAGLRGRFSAKEQTGTLIGTVDHADLVWLNTLMPIDSGLAQGECAVTFTAELDKKGVRSVAGNFLPLNAGVKLPGLLEAQGIKGAVQFRIEKKEEKKPEQQPQQQPEQKSPVQ